jgi:precorrin-3B synthase
MNPSGRTSQQDACPGALEVHEADDGNLARIRIPGGVLLAEQLRRLVEAAAQIGDSHLELTSRGNIQLRGLAASAEIDLVERLRDVGLLPSDSHERVRNIAASAASGRDGLGWLDVRPLVDELDQGLCATPVLARLSGRFLFTIDDGRNDVSGLAGDVGLLGTGPDTVALFLAGVDSGLRTRPDGAVALALAAAGAFLAQRDALGSSAWRLAELGPEAQRACALFISTTGQLWRSDALIPTARTSHRPVLGALRQCDGLMAISAGVPLGRLNVHQAETLGRVADDGSGEMRATPWRTVLLPDLPPDKVDGWLAVLGSAGLGLSSASPLFNVSSCAGRPGCARSLADVRGDALRIHTAPTTGTPLPVHWSGCQRGCGRPADRHVQVRAVGTGYEVSLDGEVRSRVDDGPDLARLTNVVEALRSGS